MLVTLFGIVMDVRPVQPEKAASPILVTLSEIVIDLRLGWLGNALLPMEVNPSGKEILVIV